MAEKHSQSIAICLVLRLAFVSARGNFPALGATSTCPDSILPETGVNGRTLVKLPVPPEEDPPAFCCEACSKATNCDAWEAEPGVCYLQELWTDNRNVRSNMKGNECFGRVNTGFNSGKVYRVEMVPPDVPPPEKDAQCCDFCNEDPACEGWQIVAFGGHADECQLFTFSYPRPGRQSGLSTNAPAPHYEGTCNVVPETEGIGKFIERHPLVSKSQEDQDGECCELCTNHPDCEFWVRDTTGNPNWCRLMKDWRHSAEWRTKRRTGFKVANLADAMYCKVLDFIWGVAGAILKRITFNVGGIKNMRVELGQGFKCEKLSFMNNQVVGNLYDVTVNAFMGLDDIKGINGNASVHLRADPNIVIDFNTCQVPHFRINDWNEGFGIDGNTGAYQRGVIGTNGGLLSGSYHSNLRRAGCGGVLVGIPNMDPYRSSRQIGFFPLDGDTHYANDLECCQKCEEDPDCDVWRTSKGYKDDGRQCTLYSFWAPDDRYNGNWKGEDEAMVGFRGLGHTHSLLYVSGDSPEEREDACASMCEADEKCDLWVQSTINRRCMLQGALRNSGWIGIGRPIVNFIVDIFGRHIFNKLMKHICGLGGIQTVLRILETLERWTTDGDGLVTVDLPTGFWDSSASDFLTDEASYTNLTLASNVSDLKSIKANQSMLDGVVHAFVEGFAQDFAAGNIAQQIGTPIAFFVGSLIKECVETGCNNGAVTLLV